MATTQQAQRFDVRAEGCFFDSARGIYKGVAVINLARSYGWQAKGYSALDLTTQGEFFCEAWDDAENYMQQFAPTGYWFGCNDNGDWGLWRDEDEYDPATDAPSTVTYTGFND